MDVAKMQLKIILSFIVKFFYCTFILVSRKESTMNYLKSFYLFALNCEVVTRQQPPPTVLFLMHPNPNPNRPRHIIFPILHTNF